MNLLLFLSSCHALSTTKQKGNIEKAMHKRNLTFLKSKVPVKNFNKALTHHLYFSLHKLKF